MALITTSAIISDIKGRINGSVFQRSQGGLTMRTQSGVINRNSVRQNTQKIYASIIQRAWQSLTPAERTLWNTYAVFRPVPTRKNILAKLSGQQVFFYENNLRLNYVGLSAAIATWIVTTPILASLPNPIQATTIVRAGVALTMNFSTAYSGVTEAVILYASRPLLASQVSGYIKTAMMRQISNGGTTVQFNVEYNNTYGRTANVGEYIAYECGRYSSVAQTVSALSKGIIQVT